MQMTLLTVGQRLRFMWNRRRSNFLIIHCSFGGIKRFIFPIPLLVLDITLAAAGDLALVADLFAKPSKKFGWRVSFQDLVRQFAELINELRGFGRWQAVRVEAEKVSVYIDFW